MSTQKKFDAIIVGAGPIGLAIAIALKKKDISYLIIEKGCLVNSIYNFPSKMTFFTYNYDIAIGGIPFASDPVRPTRQEALAYYRSVTQSQNLNINLYEEVTDINGSDGNFQVITKTTKAPRINNTYSAKKIFIATGYFDNPNVLNIEGENNPELCSHYYTDPHPFFGKHVAIIGGGNSAAEAALDLYRHGVRVTIIHKGSELKEAIKYWVMPDIQGRIREGQITAFFNATVRNITPKKLLLLSQGKELILEDVDFTFALTGYHPNYEFFKKIGLLLNEDGSVQLEDKTFEASSKKGVFVIGSAAYGKHLNKIFIENGRLEAVEAVNELIID